MSLVIAIKDKNRIVLGADKQTSIGNNKDHLATKIWEVSDLPGALMGSVGSVRVSQILQYSELIDKNSLGEMPTFEFIVRSLVPIIRATLEGNGVRCSFPEAEDSVSVMMPNSLLFAYKDRAFVINPDLCVSCGTCAGACPVEAISEGDASYVIDADTCLSCGSCASVCPSEAISEGE